MTVSLNAPATAPMRVAGGGVTVYVRWAALAIAALFAPGYSTIGFAMLFFGQLWLLIRRREWLWSATAADLPLAFFGAALAASAILSPYRSVAGGVTLMLIVSGAVYFGGLTWLLRRDPGVRGPLLRAWGIGSAVTGLAGLAYSLSHPIRLNGGEIVPERAEIFHGVGPNGLGTTMLLGSVLGLGLAFRARGRERAFWLLVSAIGFMALLASASRASIIGWVAAIGYLIWRELRGRPRLAAAILAGGLAVFALLVVASPQLMSRVRYTMSDVTGNRVRIWETSLEMIADRPLLGTGFGTFQTAYDRRKGPGMSSEPFAFDMGLNLAVETGLLGLLGACWVGVAAARAWRRSGRAAPPGVDPFRAVIGALWLGLLVDQLADNTLFSISTSAGLWLLLALVLVPAPTPSRAPTLDPASQESSGPAAAATRHPAARIGVTPRRLAFALFTFGPVMSFFFLPLLVYRIPMIVYLNNNRWTYVAAHYVGTAVALCVVWFGLALAIVLWPGRVWARAQAWTPAVTWAMFLIFSLAGSAIALLHEMVAMPTAIEDFVHQLSLMPALAVILGVPILHGLRDRGGPVWRVAVVWCLLMLDLGVSVLTPLLLARVAPAAFTIVMLLYGLSVVGVSWRRLALVSVLVLVVIAAAFPAKEYLRARFYGTDAYQRLGFLSPHLSGQGTPPASTQAQADAAAAAAYAEKLRVYDVWEGGLRFHRAPGLWGDLEYMAWRGLNRINRLSDLAYVVEMTPAQVPYAGGRTYVPLVGKFVPRLFWKNKPEEDAGQFYGHRYEFLDPSDTTHSDNLPMVTEGWINGGWAGIVLSAIFVGVVLRVVWTTWVGDYATPANVLIGAVVVGTAANGEVNLSLIIGGVIHAVVVYWAIMALVEWWGRRRGMVTSPGPGTA
ncbi:MAG TPA: O-antigen ligase family protein [bacterium]|nr:O-antigen ligase family protein [bacterium]